MLKLDIDSKSATPIYRQIYDQIHLAITTGALLPGEKLPTQDEFRKNWGIHIETVLRAIRDLEREGLIESRKSHGRFVSTSAPSMTKSERSKLLRERTKSYLAGLAPLRVTLMDVLRSIRDNWKGRTTR